MKRVLLSLLVIVSLFVVVGCDKSNTNETSSNNLHKAEFKDMRYNEPKNYSKKEPMDMAEYKSLVYRFNDDEKKTINLYYNTNTSQFYNNEDNNYEEVEINGFKWKKFHDDDFGVVYDTYLYVYKDALYTIELNAVDKYKDEFDAFMKDVSFE